MKNVPITGKLLTVIAIFGVCVTGVALYATGQMRSIDNGYNAVGEHHYRVAINIARANRALYSAHAAMADLLIATNDADNSSSLNQLDGVHKHFEDSTGQAIETAPSAEENAAALAERA